MKTIWANLQYALYCASILVGAGVLTLPLTGRMLGFGPLIIITIVVALWLVIIYRRMAYTLFANVIEAAHEKTNSVKETIGIGAGVDVHKQGWHSFFSRQMIALEAQKGAELFDEIIRRTGIGSAGNACLLVGMFFYVFFADIGYIIIGNRSLNAVVGILQANGFTLFPLFLITGLVFITTAFRISTSDRHLSALQGSFLKFLMMAGWWSLAIYTLGTFDGIQPALGDATIGSVLGAILFLGAIVSAMFTATKVTSTSKRKSGLNAQHRVNVLVMVFELALLMITAASILWLFIRADMLESMFGVASGWLTLAQAPSWTRVLGVVLFAYVGTGIFNLTIYPQLFDNTNERRLSFKTVVVLGTIIPMFLYIMWIFIGAITLSPQELAIADANNEPTHIVIAAKLTSISPYGAWLITITGYLFALMAVTSACNGFTESLADRIQITYPTTRGWPGPLSDFRPIILVFATLVALSRDIFSAAIDISAILSIAGNAGGGLLILILPLFFPYPTAQSTRVRSIEIAIAVITALVLTVGILLEPTSGTNTISLVITWIKYGVAAGVMLMTSWLLISEFRLERSSLATVHQT